SLDTMERAIAKTVIPLRDRLRVDGPFGIALRLDREGVRVLRDDDARRGLFRGVLQGSDLVPFTANAFVMGEFHGPGVKASVYRPTWHERERLDFTLEYAEAMASLRGSGHRLSLSTVPGSFKLFDEGPGVVHGMAVALATAARRLRGLEDTTG